MDPRTSFTDSTLGTNGKSAIDKAEAKVEIQAEKTNMKAASADISDALQQMKEAAGSVLQALSSIGLASTDIAKQKVNKSKESAAQLETTAEDYLRERPLAAVGIAFVAGWVISKLLQGGRKH